MPLLGSVKEGFEQAGIPQNAHQQIVEIVGDAAGQLAERLQFLGFVKLGHGDLMLGGPLLAPLREHIGQAALSQQTRRLERELNVRLFNRDTHHVGLTPAGAAFLVDARQLLAHAERAAAAARRATAPPVLRAGLPDACCDSVPRLLQVVQERFPDLEIHQVEASVPEQLRLLAEGKPPACAQTCPTEALIFGDLDDSSSPLNEVLRRRAHYRPLEELGTQPKLYYLT